MGTELTRRGIQTTLPLWSALALIECPDAVRDIHLEYVNAGTEVITTNTFRTHRRSLDKGGVSDRAEELTAMAVRLAREAIDGAPGNASSAWVADSIASLEDCYSPDLTPDDTRLQREHEEIASTLAACGVDVLLVETMPTIREAAAATRAAVATGLPVWTGFACDTRGRLISGEAVADAATAVEALGAQALLINCTPTHGLHRALSQLAAASELPIGAYGNVGHSEDDQGWTLTDAIGPQKYAEYAARWLDLGSRIVGGCCGTTPAHTAALKRLLSRA